MFNAKIVVAARDRSKQVIEMAAVLCVVVTLCIGGLGFSATRCACLESKSGFGPVGSH